MTDNASIISELSRADLARFIPTIIRRIVLHNGIWFSEVLHQLGLEEAMAAELDAAKVIVPIVEKRIGGALKIRGTERSVLRAMRLGLLELKSPLR